MLSSVLQLLGTVLIQKVNFLRDVKEMVELLKHELHRMQCFLRDANKKQGEDERVRNWIADIRDVALDAKDAIDTFLLKMEKKGHLGKFSAFPKHVHYVNKVGKEIESIQHRLDAIRRSREMYGIRDLEEAADGSTAELRRRIPPWQFDEHLVGMDGDVRKLLEGSVLDDGRKGRSVAVVVGMGGIGKSTLARRVYNHPEVAGGVFGCRGWVVVSSGFDARETMKQLILQVPRGEEEQRKLHDEMEMWSKDDKLWLHGKLEEELHKQLRGKKYFIVLDDVWDTEHLDSLVRAFPDEPGSYENLFFIFHVRTYFYYLYVIIFEEYIYAFFIFFLVET